MSGERSISDALLRRQSQQINEASFQVGNDTYTSAFGRYYKNGEQIERDDYFKAKEVDSSKVSGTFNNDVFQKSAGDHKIQKGKQGSYFYGTEDSAKFDASVDAIEAEFQKVYPNAKKGSTSKRQTILYDEESGNSIVVSRSSNPTKSWLQARKLTQDDLDKVKPIEKKAEKPKKSVEEPVGRPKTSDDELLARHREGDSEATNAIINKYEGLVRYIAKSYFAPGADIDDMAQEGLLGVYDAMDQYVPGKNKDFKQFAILSAKRNILNFIEKQNRKKNSALNQSSAYGEYQADYDVPTPLGNPELEYAKKENQNKVSEFLKNNLTDNEQKVLALYLQNYKTREIMDKLGLSNKGVENAMMRVRKKVKAWQESQNESKEIGALLESDMDKIDRTPKSMYDKYLQKHRRMVLEVYETIMRPALQEDGYSDEVLNKIYENILVHDESKYNDDEWDAYQNYFYDKEKHPRTTDEFNEAWNHHQKRNPHHWQYWCLVNDVDEPQIQTIDMPLVYIVEMLCDWHAAGKHYGNTAKEWYDKQSQKMKLSDNTRFMVENYISLLS